MHKLERLVLNTYAGQPESVLSTTQIVRSVFPDEYARILQEIESPDPSTVKRAKRNKAKLHRKLLYHVSKLVEQGALKVAGTQEHGEKSYSLALQAGEIVIADNKQTIAITKHQQPETFVKKEEDERQVMLLDDKLHTVDAYIVNCLHYPGISHLRRDLGHVYTHVSDALGLMHFEQFLDQDQSTLGEALTQLVADAKDYQVAITLHIDISRKPLQKRHLSFISQFAMHHPKRVYLVFSGTLSQLRKQHTLIEEVASILSASQVKLNLQNAKQHPHPIIFGKAGTYTITDNQERILTDDKGCILSPASYVVDLSLLDMNNPKQFRELLVQVAKSMLARAALQRRVAATTLTGLGRLGNIREQLSLPTCYMRLWNYHADHPHAMELLTSAQEELNRFCQLESMIFASCGVPIDFSIQLSSAFPHFGPLSPRTYAKKPVYGRSSLSTQQLEKRELLERVFACDRVRFFREGNYAPADLVSEILYVLGTFTIPLVTYDFKELQKTMSLTNFL